MVKNMTAEQGRTKEIVLFGLFTALTAIGAFIRIPVPVCPFTLQLLFTTLAGLILGSREARFPSGCTSFWAFQACRSSRKEAVLLTSSSQRSATSSDSSRAPG